MHKNLFAGIVGFGLLAGCLVAPQVGMKLESPGKPPTTLIGNFVDDKTQKLSVSDGELACSGTAAPRSRMWRSQTLSFPNINCSDGRTGSINLNITIEMDRGTAKISGLGVGRLNDGTKVKVMMGDMTAMMSW